MLRSGVIVVSDRQLDKRSIDNIQSKRGLTVNTSDTKKH